MGTDQRPRTTHACAGSYLMAWSPRRRYNRWPRLNLRLQTEGRTNGIYLRMWPLHRSFRRILWAAIERYEATRYQPLREFGG